MNDFELNSGQIQLLNFFNSKVRSFLKNDSFKILDIGYGDISIFEKISNLNHFKITAIDPHGKNREHQTIDYSKYSLFEIHEKKFDLIFDSHALHTLSSIDEFKSAIFKVSELLNSGGVFASEFMIIKKHENLQSKLNLNYLDIENWLIESGLAIRSFVFLKDVVFYQENKESEILQVVAIKK